MEPKLLMRTRSEVFSWFAIALRADCVPDIGEIFAFSLASPFAPLCYIAWPEV